jgi:uncharacterized membrane protein
MANESSDGHSAAAQAFNLVLAYAVHLVVGLPLVLVFAVAAGSARHAAVGWVWGLCALAVWVRGAVRAAHRRADIGAAWGSIFAAWLLGALGPIGAAVAAYSWFQSSDEQPPEEPVNPELERRLDLVSRRLDELTRELADIRRIAEGGAVTPPATAPPTPPPAPVPAAPPPEPKPLPTFPAPLRAERKPKPRPWDRELDFGELMGAKGLAWAGGIVTVLGVVFFFVLAVNRGWIGPAERVGLGALASLLVFSGGLWLHRRFGPVYSAYGAVGAGIAGGYATLVAAAALYELVSDLGALAIAAGIAAVGLATSLVWGSELVAGIGLIGATLVPMMVLFEKDLSPIGTAFAGIVFAASAAVALRRNWPRLLAAAFVASLPQIAILVADGEPTDWDRVALACLFSALYVAAAIGLHWSREEGGLSTLSATLVIVSGVLSGATGAALFSGDERGWAIIVAALAFGVLAAALFPRPADRDLSALLGAVALALAAIGLALILTGPSLAIAWAAEAAVLAWLAQRIDEPRYAIAALAYLGAAAVDAVIEAPPADLYQAVSDPARGALAPMAVALGAAVVAFYSREWRRGRRPQAGFFAYLEPALAAFREAHEPVRWITAWLAGIAAVYAASLGLLGFVQAVDDSAVQLAFERGHVFVLALWGLVAIGLVIWGRRRDSRQLTAGGLLLAGATLVQAATFDLVVLDGDRLGVALLVAAATGLATAFADEFPLPAGGPKLSIPGAFFAVASVCLAVSGLLALVDHREGAVLLGIALFYLALAALVFRADRDFSAALWAPALVVGIFAAAELTSGTWLVLAWSAVAAALAVVSYAVDEQRLAIGSAGYLALALGYALGAQAPPDEFFSANSDPAAGVPSLAFAVAAGVVFALYALRSGRWKRFRTVAFAAAAVLSMYAISLTILGLFEWVGTASVETNFQRGHSAASAFWGIVGLIALYVGLTRELTVVRLAGFALFGLALAKIFLYDLANLSSITRALSFLAVGAILLLAGFFYQRLTTPTKPAT